MEANQNTTGGTTLITMSELCFDMILGAVHSLKDTTHKTHTVLISYYPSCFIYIQNQAVGETKEEEPVLFYTKSSKGRTRRRAGWGADWMSETLSSIRKLCSRRGIQAHRAAVSSRAGRQSSVRLSVLRLRLLHWTFLFLLGSRLQLQPSVKINSASSLFHWS